MQRIDMTRFLRVGVYCILGTLVATALLMAPVAGVRGQEPTVSNTPVLTVPFTTSSGTPIIPIRVDDSRVLRCILDTGMVAGVFLLDPQLGKKLDLEYVTTTPLSGSGPGSKYGGIAVGRTVRVGDLVFDDQMVIVLQESTELARMGIDAVIGATLFNRYVVQIDSEAATVSLFDPATFDPGDAGEILPLRIVQTKPYVNATINMEGADPVEVTLLVDTGASTILSLKPTTLDALRPPPANIPVVLATGVGGDVVGVVGRISSLHLGSQELTDLVVGFPNAADGNINGTVGMGVLNRFLLTVDYTNKRMMLRAIGTLRDPFEYNMAGLVTRPLEGGRIRVHSVIDDSPAAHAGVRDDDVIVAIDGRALTYKDNGRTLRLFNRHGETMTLTIERDGKTIEISLKLRRLI